VKMVEVQGQKGSAETRMFEERCTGPRKLDTLVRGD
jgi:hypothetical protein